MPGHLFFQQRIDKPFSHQTVQLAQSADTRDACSPQLAAVDQSHSLTGGQQHLFQQGGVGLRTRIQAAIALQPWQEKKSVSMAYSRSVREAVSEERLFGRGEIAPSPTRCNERRLIRVCKMRMEGVITVNAISGICRAKTSWCYSRPGQWSVPVGETAVLYGPRAFCLRCAAAFCAESFLAIFNWQGGCRRPGRRQRIFRRQRSTVASG